MGCWEHLYREEGSHGHSLTGLSLGPLRFLSEIKAPHDPALLLSQPQLLSSHPHTTSLAAPQHSTLHTSKPGPLMAFPLKRYSPDSLVENLHSSLKACTGDLPLRLFPTLPHIPETSQTLHTTLSPLAKHAGLYVGSHAHLPLVNVSSLKNGYCKSASVSQTPDSCQLCPDRYLNVTGSHPNMTLNFQPQTSPFSMAF